MYGFLRENVQIKKFFVRILKTNKKNPRKSVLRGFNAFFNTQSNQRQQRLLDR